MICPNCKCFVPTNLDCCQYCGCFLDTGSTKTISVYDIPEYSDVTEKKKLSNASHSPDYLLYISIIILIIILLLCFIAVII